MISRLRSLPTIKIAESGSAQQFVQMEVMAAEFAAVIATGDAEYTAGGADFAGSENPYPHGFAHEIWRQAIDDQFERGAGFAQHAGLELFSEGRAERIVGGRSEGFVFGTHFGATPRDPAWKGGDASVDLLDGPNGRVAGMERTMDRFREHQKVPSSYRAGA